MSFSHRVGFSGDPYRVGRPAVTFIDFSFEQFANLTAKYIPQPCSSGCVDVFGRLSIYDSLSGAPKENGFLFSRWEKLLASKDKDLSLSGLAALRKAYMLGRTVM